MNDNFNLFVVSLLCPVWWKCFRVSIGSKVTMAAVLVCPFCVRSVSCAFWNWFDSCPTCAVNWSSCCAPWTTWPSFSPCSFSSFSYSGTILSYWRWAKSLSVIFVYNSLSLSLSPRRTHTHTHTQSSFCTCVCVRVRTTCTLDKIPCPILYVHIKEREREREFLDGGCYESGQVPRAARLSIVPISPPPNQRRSRFSPEGCRLSIVLFISFRLGSREKIVR